MPRSVSFAAGPMGMKVDSSLVVNYVVPGGAAAAAGVSAGMKVIEVNGTAFSGDDKQLVALLSSTSRPVAVGFAPRTYVVTGASSGIGLELVTQLAARGDSVFATCRKRESSATGVDQISDVKGDVTIVEGIDVASDSVKAALAASALAGITIDMVVHNAGGINGTRALEGMAVMSEQSLDAVSTERMVAAFQLNTVGPLRVQQALNPQMASPGGKIAIISTGMGSIADNSSGGLYAYRASKAAVNMVAKNMACDLKDKGIAVLAINPGLVVTEFGPGREVMTKMGGMTVQKSASQLIQAFDGMAVGTTGRFMTVDKNGDVPKDFPAGW